MECDRVDAYVRDRYRTIILPRDNPEVSKPGKIVLYKAGSNLRRGAVERLARRLQASLDKERRIWVRGPGRGLVYADFLDGSERAWSEITLRTIEESRGTVIADTYRAEREYLIVHSRQLILECLHDHGGDVPHVEIINLYTHPYPDAPLPLKTRRQKLQQALETPDLEHINAMSRQELKATMARLEMVLSLLAAEELHERDAEDIEAEIDWVRQERVRATAERLADDGQPQIGPGYVEELLGNDVANEETPKSTDPS